MVISKSNMHFRNERARELERMAKLLDKCIGNDVNTSSIYKAIGDLRNENSIPVLKDGSYDQAIWGYDIENFEISLETLKHVKPTSIKNGKIFVSIKLRASIGNWLEMNDPFIELGYNVFIKGIGDKVYHFGFHIDRHNSNSTSTEPHPIYHLQYNINPTNSDVFDSGSIMYIDTPRLVHYPLDFILGIGFLTSNFFPTAFKVLSEESEYFKLNEEYQKRIWKPYFHTLANHWKPFESNTIIWNSINDLCPILV